MPEKEPKLYKDKEPQTSKEKKEEPKISYEIFYSPHETAKDIAGLEELFRHCDIYVPEARNWTPELLADFQALSQGEKTPNEVGKKYYNALEKSAKFKTFEIIYKSRKPILFADLGAGHKLEKIKSQVSALHAQSFNDFGEGNFQLALQTMRESVAKEAEYHQKREEIIKANLKTKIKELIENSPQFKNIEEIKVLLSLGSFHTQFFHSLKKEKPSTLWQFANLPLVFMSEDETIRRIIFSKELKDELLAKIFIEHFLNNYFDRITDDSRKINRIIRKMTAKISFDEIKKLSENWTGLDKLAGQLGFPPSLADFFRDKGIKIPENEKEIDEMLGENKSAKL